MVLTSMSPGDTDAALSVWKSSGARRPLSRELFEEKVWGDADVGSESSPMRVVARDAGGHMIGFGIAVPRSVNPQTGAIKLLAVSAEHQRRGVGNTIVGRLVEALRAADCTTARLGESPPNYFQPGVDESNDAARKFFERHGWIETGRVYDMSCALTKPFSTPSEDLDQLTNAGLTIRRVHPSDQEQLRTLLDRHWPAWKPELAAASRVEPAAIFLAVTNSGSVAAFAAHSANNASLGWFGPMGTDPDFRGLGVGHVLLRLCLNDLRDAGFASCTIPWVGPVSFYEQAVGAEVVRTIVRYSRELS